MSKTIKEHSKIGRNKHTRRLVALQKQIKRGKFSRYKATKLSAELESQGGKPTYYMQEVNDIKKEKGKIKYE